VKNDNFYHFQMIFSFSVEKYKSE